LPRPAQEENERKPTSFFFSPFLDETLKTRSVPAWTFGVSR